MTSPSVTRFAVPNTGAASVAGYRFRWPRFTRRGVQVTLGGLWLIDALLQLQPFMFTASFANRMLVSAGAGQPAWVATPVEGFARIVAEHPIPLNAGFALVQFALGIGFLFPCLVRPAIVASVAWSTGIWWLGEGLGGLASGHASLITGAPGAVLLYAVLALAAWPLHRDHAYQRAGVAVTGWFPVAWAILWLGGAVLQLATGPGATAALRDQIGATNGLPDWLAQLHLGAGAALGQRGSAPFLALAAVMAMVGLAGLAGRPWRIAAASMGAIAATVFWILGQDIGQLYSGMATDPNTGPLIVLMALALAGTATTNRASDN